MYILIFICMYAYILADMVTQIVSTPAPKIGECTPQTELAYDAIEKFVVVETEVLTTVGKVCCSEVWVAEWYGVVQCGVVVDTEVLTTVGKVCRSELQCLVVGCRVVQFGVVAASEVLTTAAKMWAVSCGVQ